MPEKVVNEHPYQPTLKVGSFEGPLDLLLHLIRVNKMDIYDIQIVTITSQYMAYLHQMQAHQLEVAGDYFVMAATLMAIKSKMLLPTPVEEETDAEAEADNDDEDPREQLVAQLLEYQRYQKAASDLKDKEELRAQEYTRAATTISSDQVSVKVSPGITLGQLQAAFLRVVKRHERTKPLVQTVRSETISVATKIKDVVKRVHQGPVEFADLFGEVATRDNLVTTFMAVLELAKHQVVILTQKGLFAPISVKSGPKIDEYEDDHE